MRLAPGTLDQLAPHVARPAYDRRGQGVGIVHFGLGAFARAHLAAYCDAAMAAGESGWAISGVSLRSDSVARQLEPQRGLYTLTTRGAQDGSTRVISALREVLVAGTTALAVVERIASPDCHMVSFTVTEKGYCRQADGRLDFNAAGRGFYPLLSEGMRRRMAAGLPGLTLLSCDNLPANGQMLRRLLEQYVASDPALEDWFDRTCTTPCTMVDRIVPATTAADLDTLQHQIGLRDEGAVFAEPFSQWVIEDAFAGPRPRWEEHGVQVVPDVAPYETAKLRMLNGAHSLLAYAGLWAGHEYVHQAIADPRFEQLVRHLMLEEAAPTIAAAPGQDLGAYATDLIARFANPALGHRLAQIAMDGSQKIPQRWLAVLAHAQRPCPAIMAGLAAWLRHIADKRWLDDPLSRKLQAIVADGDLAALFGQDGLLASDWRPSGGELAALEAGYRGEFA